MPAICIQLNFFDVADIDFTWHDATDMHSPMLARIVHRIRHARTESRKGREDELRDSGALFSFSWANDISKDEHLDRHDISGSELWKLPYTHPLALKPLPPDPHPYTGESEYAPSDESCVSVFQSL